MEYRIMLKQAIAKSGYKLNSIAEKIGFITGNKPTRYYLSRLQNGKTPPAGDNFNDALAKVLGIDPIKLKAAAYREKIPSEILKELTDHDTA